MFHMFYLNYTWHYNGLNSTDVPLSNKQTIKGTWQKAVVTDAMYCVIILNNHATYSNFVLAKSLTF